jgi:hypothetical protein
MCVIRVENEKRRKLIEEIVETRAEELVRFFRRLGKESVVVFEEGCQSKWLYQVLAPYAGKVIVCQTRGQKVQGQKNDKVDTVKLLDGLRGGTLRSVYQGEAPMRGLKELAASYLMIVDDCRRVMNRMKAAFRSRGIRCVGKKIYGAKGRAEWLDRLDQEELRLRVEQLYRQLDVLMKDRKEARRVLVKRARKESAHQLLGKIPGLGPIRVALILAYVMSPHRFRTKRQFWTYSGLAVVTWSSGEYEKVDGRIVRNKKRILTRGLNANRHPVLKDVFRGAAQLAIGREMKEWFEGACGRGLTADHAKLDVARKIAAMTLAIWKTGVPFDIKRVNRAA